MHNELVQQRKWISERRFLHLLNYCMVRPSPEAQQLRRTVVPSPVLQIFLLWIYVTLGSVPAVAGVLYGVNPAVAAIVVQAAYRIGSRSLRRPVPWTIAVGSFLLTII